MKSNGLLIIKQGNFNYCILLYSNLNNVTIYYMWKMRIKSKVMFTNKQLNGNSN